MMFLYRLFLYAPVVTTIIVLVFLYPDKILEVKMSRDEYIFLSKEVNISKVKKYTSMILLFFN